MKWASQPKCASASTGLMLTTGTFSPRPSGLGDGPHRHALLVDCMVDGAWTRLLDRQTVEPRHIRHVCRRPPIATVTDVGRDTRLACDRRGIGDQALLARVVYLRQSYHRSVDAALR